MPFRPRHLVPLLMVALAAQLAAAPALADAGPIPTTLTVETSPNPAWVGDDITVTFKVSPIPDGGLVTIGGPGWPVDPVTGIATTTWHATLGLAEFSAWFMGTANYLPSPIVVGSTVVRQHPVVATLAVPAEPIGRGDSFNVTVNLDEAPDGGVVGIERVNADGEPILGFSGSSSPAGGGQPITITLPGQEPGSYLVRAFYGGTDAYAAAASDIQSIEVFDRPTVTSIHLEPETSKWGEPVAVTVAVSPIPDDGGAVSISRDGHGLGWATMDWSTGQGTFDLGWYDPGTYALQAEFHPSGWPLRWAPSSGTATQIISTDPIETDPPVGWVSINNGDELTTDGYVVVSMHATDASFEHGGSVQMSCDLQTWENAGTADGDWGWGFGNPGCSSEQGVKTIYVRWTDMFGNATTASDSIILENAPPVGSVVVDGGVAFTDASTVDLNVTATDPATGVSLVALSNDGQSWTTRAYAPTQSWQLATGAGSKTVHVKWRDGYGQWSSPKTDAIVVDTTPATGTVTIAGGATYASGRSVTLATPATDTLSGVSQIALSNDGASWTSKPYAPSIAWTLPATNGNRTVWVKWRNGAGMWSPPRTDSIILDTIAPAATAPLTALQTGSLGSGGPTVGVTWSGNDATSGIARYEVAQSKDGGAFSTIAAAVTNTRLQLSVSDGHRYAFAVRAIDRAGHTSAWSMGPVLRSTVLAESAAGLSYAGAWSTVKGAGFLGGSARVSSTAGASASYTFSGSSVAWLAGRGPTLGRMTVIVDGAVAGTVDLYRSTATFREVVFSKSWATSGSHTIRLVNQGTLGHPGVVLDGLMTLSGRVFGRVVVAR